MKCFKYRVFGAVVAYSLTAGQYLDADSSPIYLTSINLDGSPASHDESKPINPFLFQQTLNGSEGYTSHTIVLKENWKSFSVDIETKLSLKKREDHYVFFKLIDRKGRIYNGLFFEDLSSEEGKVLQTKDPDVPRDGIMRPLQHEGKELKGKHRVRLERLEGRVFVYYDGSELLSFEPAGDFDHVAFGVNGYELIVSNLTINGEPY